MADFDLFITSPRPASKPPGRVRLAPDTRHQAALLLLAIALCAAAIPAGAQHPGPQPRPGPSQQQTIDGTTFVVTPEGQFPAANGMTDPPGSNFLPTVYTNMFDRNGDEMPNTLPSHPDNPWNLHVPFPDGKPVKVTQIDPTSPSQVIKSVIEQVRDQARATHAIDRVALQRGIDVLEGNRLPEYPWSGFPLLHYIGPTKVKKVVPIWNVEGDTIGGNVNVHQVWYDSHIESDTAFIDPSKVLDVPWTITYTIDCLYRCSDDFSPAVMYFDAPPPAGDNPAFGPPHVAMDQTFFPMEAGTRTVFKLKMAPGKYYNLTYTWGWRVHPPRVQVSENATKLVGGKNIVQWEIDVFGPNPRANEAAKLAAIAKIGELSPAKQMWMALRQAREETEWSQVVALMDRALIAYFDWSDRTELPTGAKHLEDPEATMSLLYVNNTIYGKIKDGGWDTWREWETRPAIFKVSLFNGDHFPHGYISADFGGSRGWENQFEPTIAEGGTGCKFSFGRFHWWLNAGGPWGAIIVPPVDPNDYTNVGRHKVHMTLNFEPSRRIRIYQFDPLHHDVSIFSLH